MDDPNKKYVIFAVMKKKIIIIVSLLAVLLVLVMSSNSLNQDSSSSADKSFFSLPSFSFLKPKAINQDNAQAANEAWATLQGYMTFAKNHDLAGLRTLSHQISPECNDPAKEKECFDLMDSASSIASELNPADFKHIERDGKQIVMYTDPPGVWIIYFTRDEQMKLRVLGLQFCIQQADSKSPCVDPTTLKTDTDADGWWDTTEALFYNK